MKLPFIKEMESTEEVPPGYDPAAVEAKSHSKSAKRNERKKKNVNREELVKEAIEQGTKLVQAVADALFNLLSTEDPDGPTVKLPAPTTKLSREKPTPAPSVMTHGPTTSATTMTPCHLCISTACQYKEFVELQPLSSHYTLYY